LLFKEVDLSQEKDVSKKENQKTKTVKKRTSKTQTELKKLNKEIADLKDQLLRKVAEFDNYRKRTEREFYDRMLNANERLITELLPIMDDFERSLAHASEAPNPQALIEGFELIYKKLSTIFEKEGLKTIEATGKEFDPDQHDALMQMDSEDHESGTIIEEHLKGYKLNDKVIRHSQVLVAK
jgi:molecular chaperone GrpE